LGLPLVSFFVCFMMGSVFLMFLVFCVVMLFVVVVSTCVPVSLVCPFSIAPSVLSNVYVVCGKHSPILKHSVQSIFINKFMYSLDQIAISS
jgi:hypothetical protein